MDLLRLPSLHPSIPERISPPDSEEVFFEFMRARAIQGFKVPRPKGGETISNACQRQLNSMLNEGADSLEFFSGELRLVDTEHLGDYRAGTNLNLAWVSAGDVTSVDDFVSIGGRLQQLENAQPGLAETFLAILEEASNALGYGVLHTPAHTVTVLDDIEWEGSMRAGLKAGLSIEEIDDKCRGVMMEYRDCDPSEIDESELPSGLLCGLAGGGINSAHNVLKPKRQCKVTKEALLSAGFTGERAERTLQLVDVDLPSAIRARPVFGRNYRQSFCGGDHISTVISIWDEAPMELVRFIDNRVNANMYGEDSAPVFWVAERLVDARTYRNDNGRRIRASQPKSKDPIAVMASFLNLLHRTDQLLAVLAG